MSHVKRRTIKKLSETLTELGIAFSFPIKIRDANGNVTYCEDSDGFWYKSEYDTNGNETYYEDSNGDWLKREYDSDGKETYSEDSYGVKFGTPKTQSCDGKVITVDGKQYKLTEL